MIWPENSADLDPSLDPAINVTIQGAVDAIGLRVLVGVVLQNPRATRASCGRRACGPVAVYMLC